MPRIALLVFLSSQNGWVPIHYITPWQRHDGIIVCHSAWDEQRLPCHSGTVSIFRISYLVHEDKQALMTSKSWDCHLGICHPSPNDHFPRHILMSGIFLKWLTKKTARELAQQVKVLATKPGGPSPIWQKERELTSTICPLVTELSHPCMLTRPPCTHLTSRLPKPGAGATRSGKKTCNNERRVIAALSCFSFN